MTEGELMPCPFCGGTNAKPDKNDEADFDVTCLDCHAGTIGVGPGATGMESAIAAWNTRTPTATPSGWQPIETAPKDGTAVWLAVDSQSFIGYFDPARAYSDGDEGEWVIKASFRRVQNGCDEITGYYWRKAVPTHWMPLPEPPSAIEGEKK